jgi:hypothetical protein
MVKREPADKHKYSKAEFPVAANVEAPRTCPPPIPVEGSEGAQSFTALTEK